MVDQSPQNLSLAALGYLNKAMADIQSREYVSF
jgi:hypothetical protein